MAARWLDDHEDGSFSPPNQRVDMTVGALSDDPSILLVDTLSTISDDYKVL